MQVKELKVDGLKHEFEITIPNEALKEQFNTKLQEVGKDAKIPGFRPGKAPLNVLEQRYGNSIRGEVLESAIQKSSSDALKEKELKAALRPDIKIGDYEEGKDLQYTMSVEVLPKIEDIDLSKFQFDKSVVAVEEKEIEEALTRLANENKNFESIEKGKAEDGDLLIIDFDGSTKDGPIDGGKGEDQQLTIGSGQFIPGFEEQLIGAKIGDETTINVSFPDEYHVDKLKGAPAEFKIKVKDIKRGSVPEINDEFAKNLRMENLAGLKDAIKEQIQSELDRVSFLISKRQVLDTFSDKIKMDVPKGLVDLEFDSIWKEYQEEQKQLSDEEKDKESEEKTKEKYQNIAERRVRLGLLLAEIGNAQKVEITKKELDQAIMREAFQYRGQEREAMEFIQSNDEAKARIRAPLFEDKVINKILELAKTKEVKMTKTEMQDKAKAIMDSE